MVCVDLTGSYPTLTLLDAQPRCIRDKHAAVSLDAVQLDVLEFPDTFGSGLVVSSNRYSPCVLLDKMRQAQLHKSSYEDILV